jgi:ABC-type multidrug transport system fused ATPase/permease subunit
MPRPGRPTTERAKDFKGTLRQLIRTMSHYKLPLAAAMLFAVLSTIFNIAGPKVLAKATTALATGWIARLRGTGSIDFVYIGRILLFLQGCDFLCVERNGLGVRSVGSFQFILIILDIIAKFLVTRGIGDKLLSAVFVLVPRFTTAVSAVC